MKTIIFVSIFSSLYLYPTPEISGAVTASAGFFC